MTNSSPLTALLTHRMAEQGLTVTQLALGVQVPASSIYGWLAGQYKPRPERYAKLAGALGCTVSDIALAAAGIASDSVPAAT